MALVAFLRGINVGGQRRLRPSRLAAELGHLGAVNIGAAGTFVVRGRSGREALRREIEQRVPFPVAVAVCDGRDVTRLVADNPLGRRRPTGATRFATLTTRRPRTPGLPFQVPPTGRWLVRVMVRHGPFWVGLHRREMGAIAALATLDAALGATATTRSWSTLEKAAAVLAAPQAMRQGRAAT